MKHNSTNIHTTMQEVAKSHAGFVYVLSNPSAPNMVKIGYSKHGGDSRGKAFYAGGTGLPTPYRLEFEAHTNNARQAERNVHLALRDFRVNSQREWFDCLTGEAIQAVLKYTTPDFDVELLQWPDHVDIRSLWRRYRDLNVSGHVENGYYPPTQEQFARAVLRLSGNHELISGEIGLIANKAHKPTHAQKEASKDALSELMEFLSND